MSIPVLTGSGICATYCTLSETFLLPGVFGDLKGNGGIRLGDGAGGDLGVVGPDLIGLVPVGDLGGPGGRQGFMCIRVKGQGNLMVCGPGELRFRAGEALGAIAQVVQIGTVEEDRIPDGIGAGIQQGKPGGILRPVQAEGRDAFRGDLIILFRIDEIPVFRKL